jgi:hypothetical protein
MAVSNGRFPRRRRQSLVEIRDGKNRALDHWNEQSPLEIYQMVSESDRLRTPTEVLLPDRIQQYFSVMNLRTGESRPKTLDDHYSRLNEFSLNESVPENIQIHFEVAENLLLYSWFVYRFIAIAEMQAYATTEYALRERIGSTVGKKAGLRRLLAKAVSTGLIEDNGFQHYVRLRQRAVEFDELMQNISGSVANTDPIDPQSYVGTLAEVIPQLRNDLAHGSDNLTYGTYLTFSLCRDLINQLFPAHSE